MTEVKAKKKLAHLLDATKCIGCTACIVACSETNYPEMANREIPGRGWLASDIRPVTLETRARPVQILCNANIVKMLHASRLARLVQITVIRRRDWSKRMSVCVWDATIALQAPLRCPLVSPGQWTAHEVHGAECEKRVANGENPACVAGMPVELVCLGMFWTRIVRYRNTLRLREPRDFLSIRAPSPTFSWWCRNEF